MNVQEWGVKMKKLFRVVVSMVVLMSLAVLVIHGVIFFNNKDTEDCLRNRKNGDGTIVILDSGQRMFVSNEKFDGVPDMHLCSKR